MTKNKATPYWAIQAVYEYKTKAGAATALKAFKMQDGFLGGQILPDGDFTRVQAFFQDEPSGYRLDELDEEDPQHATGQDHEQARDQ